MSKLQHSQKFVEEIHSAEVRQTGMITGNSEISRRSSHSDTDFTKSEVSVRISKVKWHSDKQGLRRTPAAPKCAGFRYLGYRAAVSGVTADFDRHRAHL